MILALAIIPSRPFLLLFQDGVHASHLLIKHHRQLRERFLTCSSLLLKTLNRHYLLLPEYLHLPGSVSYPSMPSIFHAELDCSRRTRWMVLVPRPNDISVSVSSSSSSSLKNRDIFAAPHNVKPKCHPNDSKSFAT
jgi:hypothetical protein